MDLPPTVGQKIRNLLNLFNKQCLSFMLTKKYKNVSSNNEVIVKTSNVFLEFSKHFLNKRWPFSATVFV